MFGYITANQQELTGQQQVRYRSIYCGICRQLSNRWGSTARLVLRYDMAFLALLLMSLYEPREQQGSGSCIVHPVTRHPWVDNEYIRYAADMNVILAYYNCRDDWQDDGKVTALAGMKLLQGHMAQLEETWPRQCGAIRSCMARLSRLEGENCPNPDMSAACFGELMGQLLTFREDLWSPHLQQLGFHLGRFVYLMDAALDYSKDRKKGRYNPFLAMGQEEDWQRWEEYLILAMGKATESFEMLPLVQDKDLLDNILYSGVWTNRKRKMERGNST